MKNYRYKASEIEDMKNGILLSIETETEKDNRGNISAWRWRVMLEMHAFCYPSKKDRERGYRLLKLYESLTENDLPKWEGAA